MCVSAAQTEPFGNVKELKAAQVQTSDKKESLKISPKNLKKVSQATQVIPQGETP